MVAVRPDVTSAREMVHVSAGVASSVIEASISSPGETV